MKSFFEKGKCSNCLISTSCHWGGKEVLELDSGSVTLHCELLNATASYFEVGKMITFMLCIFDHKSKHLNRNASQLLYNYVGLTFDVGFG